MADMMAEVSAERSAYRPPDQTDKGRPKAITDFAGIEMGLKPAQWRAVRAGLWRSFDYNMKRCGWREEDILCHMGRHVPKEFKEAVGRMTTLAEFERFLNMQFEAATQDGDDEDWDRLRINNNTVAAFYTEIENLAEQLGKSEEAVRKAFVRGFKQDHADLWRKMRTDYRAHSLSRLVRAAKEYLELTGERSGGVEPVRVQFSSGGAGDTGPKTTPDSSSDSDHEWVGPIHDSSSDTD